MEEEYDILQVKDRLENYKKKKSPLFDLPTSLCMIGKSGSGKTQVLINLISRKKYYKNDFKPENIYLFSVSANTDDKLQAMIQMNNIPEENIFSNTFDLEELRIVYEYIKDNYLEAINNGEEPEHTLLILDDLAYSGDLLGYDKDNILNQVFMNGRHCLCSCILTSQKASLIGTGMRSNAKGVIMFGMLPQKELDLLANDFNHLESKKDFFKLYHKATPSRHDFLVVNYGNKEGIYQNKNFKIISL